MKKYKLIEYDPAFSREYHTTELGNFSTMEEATNTLVLEQEKHNNFYYRIEVIEDNIIDIVKKISDAYAVCGKNGWCSDILKLTNLGHKTFPETVWAFIDLAIITAALNEGVKPSPRTQECYAIDGGPTGLRVVPILYNSTVPNCLLFKAEELAEYAASQFAELYFQLLNPNYSNVY